MNRMACCALLGVAGLGLGGALAAEAAAGAVVAGTFYVDGARGDDAAPGTSPEQAWKSLARVNGTAFGAGSRILLRSGLEYPGSLQPKGSGEPGRPIVVDRYGEGAKPRVRAQAGDGAPLPVGVLLENQEQWEIRNLDISGSVRGVFVRLQEYGPARHIHLVGLDIHDIPGGPTGDDSGILCSNSGPTTSFEDLRIEDCSMRHVDRNGILITDWPGPPTEAHRSTGVVIRNNRLTDIGGDGIFILACKGALIERNVLRYAHQRVGRRPGERACAGIWPQRSEGTLIQFNEVSHTAVGGLTVWDSEAFDDDGSCTGTIFQYNYSHDNAGGFLLNCGGKGTVVRYNLSQNDATATFTFESDAAADTRVYNNTVYVRPGLAVELVRNTFGAPHDIRFVNNIFCIAGEARYAFRGMRAVSFERNVFFGNHVERPQDERALTADPCLTAPGEGRDGMETVGGYRLAEASPCRGAGLPVADSGGRDFWGNPLPAGDAPDIGAHQAGR